MPCPFNPRHQIAKHKCPQAMDIHIESCPDKDTVVVPPPAPVIAETPMEVEEE